MSGYFIALPDVSLPLVISCALKKVLFSFPLQRVFHNFGVVIGVNITVGTLVAVLVCGDLPTSSGHSDLIPHASCQVPSFLKLSLKGATADVQITRSFMLLFLWYTMFSMPWQSDTRAWSEYVRAFVVHTRTMNYFLPIPSQLVMSCVFLVMALISW